MRSRCLSTLLILVMASVLGWSSTTGAFRFTLARGRHRFSQYTRRLSAVDDDTATTSASSVDVPIYRCEGLFAVNKPLCWTSSDVVSYIRGILERDAKNRGATVANFRSRRNKSLKVKVGHGGTLDPLASGVLVIGVGRGTKELQA